MHEKKVILCILDGWGIAPDSPGNAITKANPQVFNYLQKNYPSTQLEASGTAVGLPANLSGNSETGHLNIGAGRVVYQDLELINRSISDGSFFTNKELLNTIKHLQSFQSRLHIVGMIGNSGVHSFNDHLYALIRFAKTHHLTEVYLHLFTDGRDSPPDDSIHQIKKVQEVIDKYSCGEISSVIGRYFSMDRDLRLDRTLKAFDCLVGKGSAFQGSASQYIQHNYDQGITDEFIPPSSLGENSQTSRIRSGDAVVFFNFRTDRPRQITEMFLNSNIPNLRFVTMTRYSKNFDNPVLFSTTTVTDTLGEIISRSNFKQLRAAETEKIAMVSYYFNGQEEIPFEKEEHLFVPSPKIATYDLKPDMSSVSLVDQFIERFTNDDFKLSVINIACPDMVAHTGIITKSIEAIKASDDVMGKLVNLCKSSGSYLLITADHGNAEELINLKTGQVDTEHSNNPVPFIIYHPQDTQFKLRHGRLGDIAPTILNLLDISQPSAMTCDSLIVR